MPISIGGAGKFFKNFSRLSGVFSRLLAAYPRCGHTCRLTDGAAQCQQHAEKGLRQQDGQQEIHPEIRGRVLKSLGLMSLVPATEVAITAKTGKGR
jgi:hypothetical protein